MSKARKAKTAKPGQQLSLRRTGGWGGKRRGAGRKRAKGTRSSVPHARRPVHKGRHPVHVTLRAKAGLPSFRQQRVHNLIAQVLREQRRRKYKDDFRVLHFSIQADHLHLVVEADSERADPGKPGKRGYKPLRSGLSGLQIMFARRLNMMLKRKGNVWADRYHRHDLKTPREVHNGFAYVFDNYVHHGWWSSREGGVDPFSSACAFEGWDSPTIVLAESERWRYPICRATTWLASIGYLKHGRLSTTRNPHPRGSWRSAAD
jgi:putative transposase